tara:strand:- start:69 stop:368 length:300 start_codon:yes stop_codon:yes gene_type:complete
MIDKFHAIESLCPEAKFELQNDEVIWRDEKIKRPTDKEINDKIAELQAEYDANQYQRDRSTSYPSIQEQLDMQYWDRKNGTNKWEESIDRVKADNPKPE